MASARAMDAALAAGMPGELLTVHLAVLAARLGAAPWPPRASLAAYVADPRVRGMDELAWAAARHHLEAPQIEA